MYKCNMCGKCCSYEIPITILDLYRIAIGKNISNEEAFIKYLKPEISDNSGIFKIAKKENFECVFLKNNKCSIHNFEPNICNFYFCEINTGNNSQKWTMHYVNDENKIEKIWEQSVAIALTKVYIEKNGSNWNKIEFYKSLSSILNNIKNNNTQKIKLSTDKNNKPICLIYDCNLCDKHGELATETIITLSEISKIITFLNISWELFFKTYIDNNISKNGLLKLKRNTHCIFHLDNSECLINSVKPNHCKYTSCPAKCSSNKNTNYDRFYLGSGTIDEQYKHQASLNFTKQYVLENGNKYNKTEIINKLKDINDTINNKVNYEDFCHKIAEYRYIKPN